ncbi:MAG: hypothetical protein QM754_09740 [Tepidisphaeraceae bacterium]
MIEADEIDGRDVGDEDVVTGVAEGRGDGTAGAERDFTFVTRAAGENCNSCSKSNVDVR